MKKKLFFFAAAAVALASCSNDEVVSQNTTLSDNQQKEIAFNPLTTPLTRAAVHGITMPDQSLYVAAYQAATATGTVGNYFDKTAFLKNYQRGGTGASDDVWGGSPARYYPLGAATLNFLAVTGKGATSEINSTESYVAFDNTNYASAVTVNYTNGTAGYTDASQVDIMYATGQATVTQLGNGLTFAGGGTTSTENVAMQFNHAFALLNFQVKAAAGSEGLIEVNSITVDNAAYTGSLAITNAYYNATDATAKTKPRIQWTPDAKVANATVTGISNYTVDNTTSVTPSTLWYPNNASSWANIMIVPSDTKGASPTQRGFDSFTITYTIKATTGQAAQQYTYTYWPSGTVGTRTNVQEGKIYTYQITFNLHEIRIEPSVTNWDEQGPTGVPVF